MVVAKGEPDGSPSKGLLGRRDYLILLMTAFWWGCGTSQMTLLSVVLRHHSMTPSTIASVLSSRNFGMLLSALASGTLASRIGAVRTLLLGGTISALAIGGLPFTLNRSALAAAVVLFNGCGFGMITPSGQMFATAVTDASDRRRAIGMYTAMFLIPTFWGPVIGEWSLRRLGEGWFFGLILLPLFVALATAALLPRNTETPAPPNAAGYLALVRDRHLWLPNFSAMQSGVCFTFSAGFLPLMLVSHRVPVASYYVLFAAALLITRFVGMQYLQRLIAPHLMMIGLFAYASGLCILAVLTRSPLAAGLAGILFGLG